MSEEELFCKLFPEYVVNGKPLSPYFDLFESGNEQAENRIAELEKENAETKERIKTLEYRCENIKDTDTMELVALQRENAELQHKVDTLQGFLDRDVEFDNLQKENAGLKEQLRFAKEMPYSAVKEFAEEKTQYQLTKAKELLKKLYEETRGYMNDQGFDMNVINEVYDFIKSEVEK